MCEYLLVLLLPQDILWWNRNAYILLIAGDCSVLFLNKDVYHSTVNTCIWTNRRKKTRMQLTAVVSQAQCNTIICNRFLLHLHNIDIDMVDKFHSLSNRGLERLGLCLGLGIKSLALAVKSLALASAIKVHIRQVLGFIRQVLGFDNPVRDNNTATSPEPCNKCIPIPNPWFAEDLHCEL